MSSDFKNHSRTLLNNGYLIIPIKPGSKRPALDNWQNARFSSTELSQYSKYGIGILCGQGNYPIVAIDIDTTNKNLATRFAAWCQKNLGATCERIGNAPKILLPYRAEAAGWGKATGAWFEDLNGVRHRLEVLGKGQQFIAHHIHPDTGIPYEWTDIFGGINTVRACDLPLITRAKVEEAMQIFEAMAAEIGLVRASGSLIKVGGLTSAPENDPLMAFDLPIGIDMKEVRRLVAYVDNEDYDTWLKVGMSLHHEFDGEDAALDLWDEWSSTASNYENRKDLEKRWSTFGRSGHNPTTARWLLKVSNQGKLDAVKAEKRTALDDAKVLIISCKDSIDLVNDVARRSGQAAGTDLALRAELEGLIRFRFKELTDTNLPVADVRLAMAGGRKVATFNKQRRQMTEFGNAERMLDRYGHELMYVPEIDTWFMWTGIYWHKSSNVELEHLAKETIRLLPDEAHSIESDSERAEFFKFCAISQRAVMVRNMVSLAQSDPRVVVRMIDLDKLPHLLGVGNGVVDLTTGKLLPPDQAYHVTTITATEYDQVSACPLFEQTVADVFFGDMKMIEFFQRLVGYSILAQPTEDIIVIPYGSGSNGKSTVLGAIRDVLGEHAKMASSETFLSSGVGGGNALSNRSIS